jgi:hypothetical protein
MVEYYNDSERKENVSGYYWSRGYHHGMGNVFSGSRMMNTYIVNVNGDEDEFLFLVNAEMAVAQWSQLGIEATIREKIN